MNTAPFFSIIVPTYNQAQYLGEALDSIIGQTDADWEAVIVNDGSTDGTADILETYAQKESRFRIIHQKNGGTGSALNTALKEAKGQWVCWLSSDDVFEINKLQIHRKWINDYPDYKFFFSQCRQLVGTSGKIVNSNFSSDKAIPPIELQIIEMFKKNYVAGNSICISRESWIKTGFFNEQLRYAQDYDMWLRLMIEYRALFIPKNTYLQRIYPGQESHRFSNYCLYDSAKSSIEVLNKYTIQELFPLVNLQRSDFFKKAVHTILDIAFDPSTYIYQMGFHPLLILKIQSFLNKYAQNSDLNALFLKKLKNNSILYKNTPFGFWCDLLKYLIVHNTSVINQSVALSFQKLVESYYLWITYIESDLYEYNLQQSVLNYLHRSYTSTISEKTNNLDTYKSVLCELINFQSIESNREYIKFIQSTQPILLQYSFINKLILLEKMEISINYIAKSLIKKYGLLRSILPVVFVYLLRTLHLSREGNLSDRLKLKIFNLI